MTDRNTILQNAQQWLQPTYDETTRAEVQELIDLNEEALADAFYKDLDFGTGGMRGVMGVGTNRINKYTLGAATQGLVHYLQKQFPGEALKVAIAHDSRHHSRRFSIQVAEILAANNVEALLFEDLRPTPELSFAIRHHHCQSGIILTASHNPPEYNGYKVYWNDGGQLVPPHDKGVIQEVRKVAHQDIKFKPLQAPITELDNSTDHAYLQRVQDLSLNDQGKDNYKVVFTSIHGTTITLMPSAFENAGFKHFYNVEEQATPDGDFPTVKSPNPEEGEALTMALELARKKDADMVIGTDPDGDRVGIAVRDREGELRLINGNQAAAVLIYYILEQYRQQDLLQGKQFIAKTVVTTDLLARIAEHYQVDCHECLTGFKWIADLIRRYEGQSTFIAGGEESYGYLVGDFVRDKDAIASAVMLAEAGAYAQHQGSSFWEMLLEVYQRFGFYQEELVSLTKKGQSGSREIAQMMEDFRHRTPREIGGEKVIEMRDFQAGTIHNMENDKSQKLEFPASNVVQFITAQGTKITARPSGTEPKIKFYISVHDELPSARDYPRVEQQLRQRITAIRETLGI